MATPSTSLSAHEGHRPAEVHIKRRKKQTGYHQVVASLSAKYCPPGGSIIDIGCGVGHVLAAIALARPDAVLSAADPFDMCLDATAERVPNLRKLKISETKLDSSLLGGPYDVAVMCHSLEHMRAPADAVETALSILKPGGHLILAVPNPVRPRVFISNLFRRHYVNRGHVYAWDRSHWMNFLEEILRLDVVEYASDEVQFLPGALTRHVPGFKSIEWGVSRLAPWWSF